MSQSEDQSLGRLLLQLIGIIREQKQAVYTSI